MLFWLVIARLIVGVVRAVAYVARQVRIRQKQRAIKDVPLGEQYDSAAMNKRGNT
jgi:hypothetical protein